MAKQITVGNMQTSYLTEEDISETEEYFQQTVGYPASKRKEAT